MTYRFLQHTSDLFIEAEGRDFPSALAEIAAGMFTHMGGENSSGKGSIWVEASSQSKEGLVVSFLTEVIAECETVPFTPSSLEIRSFGESSGRFSIAAVVRGERKPAENVIKAVTYHELEVEEKKGQCRIRVLFDI